MKCQEVIELMHRYLDHDLDESEAEGLTRHVQQCSSCAEMFERLKHLSGELESLPKVMPAFSLVDAILPRLELIDRTAADAAIAEPPVVAAPPVPAAPSKRRWTDRISWRIASGVVAAGFIFGMFIVMNQPKAVDDASEEAKFDSATASQQSSAEEPSAAPFMADATSNEAAPREKSVAPDAVSRKTPISGESDGGAESKQGIAPQDQNGDMSAMDVQPEPPKMGITATPLSESPSNNGQLAAKVENGQLLIVSTDKQGDPLFKSEAKTGEIGNIVWSSDDKLVDYDVTDNGVVTHFQVDIAAKAEKIVKK